MLRVGLLAGFFGAFAHLTQASVYDVESIDWVPPFQHAEKMFASNHGPMLSKEGDTTISVNVYGENITEDMNDMQLVVFYYHVENYESFEQVADKISLLACQNTTDVEDIFDGMSNVQRDVYHVVDSQVHADSVYYVNESGWTDTQVFVCAGDFASSQPFAFSGSMEVRNPYGQLPAVLYGMLPFGGMLAIGYLAMGLLFGFLLCKHRQQVIPLHYGIQLILTLGVVDSGVWFYAFYDMNKTGAPVCCPYPPIFLASVILDTSMRTLARIMLLIVCLGYGIVRSHLSWLETISISLVSSTYFIAGIADEITRGTSSGSDLHAGPTAWAFAQLLCNLVFILWIQVSMDRILKQLNAQKQSSKLSMYKSLAWSLGAFVVFFTALTLVTVCSRLGVFEWDVEWEWMQLVAWPVLNFIVSAALSYIWRPTKNSSQFAYSTQLPMTESPGLEMTGHESSSSDDDEDALDDDPLADSSDDEDQGRKERTDAGDAPEGV